MELKAICDLLQENGLFHANLDKIKHVIHSYAIFNFITEMQ